MYIYISFTNPIKLLQTMTAQRPLLPKNFVFFFSLDPWFQPCHVLSLRVNEQSPSKKAAFSNKMG